MGLLGRRKSPATEVKNLESAAAVSEGSTVVASHCVFRNRSRRLDSSKLALGSGPEPSSKLTESFHTQTAGEAKCFFGCSPGLAGAAASG